MPWFTRWPRRQSLRSNPPHIQAVAWHNSLSEPTPPTQGQVYSQSPWVYMAVNRIAEAGALVPLHVRQRRGETAIEIERHPFEDLLEHPNPFLSRFELLEQTLGMLELTGNAYWLLIGSAEGLPAEIWPLRPDRVTIVPDEAHYVRGYLYELDGQRIALDALEVVHFRRWHPTNDYYGLSALSAAALAVEGDRAMARWNANTFGRDNGIPAGIVSIRDYVTDADFERIKREWRMQYGAGQRRTAFLRGGTIEWQNIGLSHTELDFLQGRRAHRDEILNLFGLPIGLISENATEANARVAERQFIERTLYPKLVRLAQKITQAILPFYGPDLVAAFDDIRPTDHSARLAELRTASAILSINELRARYFDLPPVPWGHLPPSARGIAGPGAPASADEQTQPARAAKDASALDAIDAVDGAAAHLLKEDRGLCPAGAGSDGRTAGIDLIAEGREDGQQSPSSADFGGNGRELARGTAVEAHRPAAEFHRDDELNGLFNDQAHEVGAVAEALLGFGADEVISLQES